MAESSAVDDRVPVLAGALEAHPTPFRPQMMLLSFQIFDLLAPLVTGYWCYRIYDAGFPDFWSVCGKVCVAATALSAMVFWLVGCYRADQLLDSRLLFRRLASSFIRVVLAAFMVAFLSKSLVAVSRIWAVLWVCSWVSLTLATRYFAVLVVQMRIASGELGETVAVIGATPWAYELCTRISRQKLPRQWIIGVFDDRRTRVPECFAGMVRPVEDLLEVGRQVRIDRVILALPLDAEARILEISRRLMALAVDVIACPDLRAYHLLCRPIVSQLGMPAVCICRRPIADGPFFAKALVDKLVSFTLLALLSPLLLAIALAIRWTSPGPVLFRQKRHGYNNREFEVLKFRSMRTDQSDESGARQATRKDSRVTALGQFLRLSSLDELPQLLNVLRGDMSLVGPRPLPVGMRTQDLCNHEIVREYSHRHRVRPGITGWAQVNGSRGATSDPVQLRRRVEMDLYYIDNWSPTFDVVIVFLTVVHLLRPHNAY